MRNISFSLTTEQIRNRTKTVARRLKWETLKPGTLLQACEKCMGLRRGEKINRLAVIRVVSVKRERVDEIMDYPIGETAKEGFPAYRPSEFALMFCNEMECKPWDMVTRIEFEYLDNA
jgi:hypothetical protein